MYIYIDIYKTKLLHKEQDKKAGINGLNTLVPHMAYCVSTQSLFNLKLSHSHRSKPSQALISYTNLSTLKHPSSSTNITRFKASFSVFPKLPVLSGRRRKFNVRTQNPITPFTIFCFYVFLGDSFCVFVCRLEFRKSMLLGKRMSRLYLTQRLRRNFLGPL